MPQHYVLRLGSRLLRRAFILVLAGAFPVMAHAELTAMSDSDLSDVDGAGIGIVLEDFVFSHEHNPSEDKIFRITGINDSSGNPVEINVKQMYISGANSDYGNNLQGVNIGRLTNPYEIDLINGDDIGLPGKGVLEIAAPRQYDDGSGYGCLDSSVSGSCASRANERPDLGLELEINVLDQAPAHLNYHVSSAVFDGSHLRLWGEDNKMAAEFRLNFYTPALEISTCAVSSASCTSKLTMTNFSMELALGNTFQPLYMGVDGVTGGLTFQISDMTNGYLDEVKSGAPSADAVAFFNDYYDEPSDGSNSPYRSYISADSIDIGGVNLGSAKIDGLLIQHLDIKLRDVQ